MDLRLFHPDSPVKNTPADTGTQTSPNPNPDSQLPSDAQSPAAAPAPPPTPSLNFKMMDRLNSWTGLLPCRFLEWSGWYNNSVRLRLLGHFRLHQHFKKDYNRHSRVLPAARAYILQYRAHHGIKYILSKAMALLYSAVMWKEYSPVVEMAAINRILVNERVRMFYRTF